MQKPAVHDWPCGQTTPSQPPWQLPGEGELAPGELRRLEKPKKRYRGLSAVRAYIDPDHVEEILDLLVFNAQRDAAGPGSVSGFLFEAVTGELERGRVLDRVGERYPAYSADGVRPKRGRRAGSRSSTPSAGQPLRPVIARIPTEVADEIRDCVIHRNGGQGDGPHTVSAFVAHAISNHLSEQRSRDSVHRYPRATSALREAHLDPRVLRSSG